VAGLVTGPDRHKNNNKEEEEEEGGGGGGGRSIMVWICISTVSFNQQRITCLSSPHSVEVLSLYSLQNTPISVFMKGSLHSSFVLYVVPATVAACRSYFRVMLQAARVALGLLSI
jgi:hypothetical protein